MSVIITELPKPDIFADNHAANVSAQTSQPRLVFVCSAGMLRSATGAKYWAGQGCNTRSCGTHAFALVPLSANLIAWADRIYFAHQENWWKALNTFAGHGELLATLQDKSQICEVPDIYDYDDPMLHAIWAKQVVLPERSASRLLWGASDEEITEGNPAAEKGE
jgi:predicted protein tyrosine phosphatase